jgi:hypothetical protein
MRAAPSHHDTTERWPARAAAWLATCLFACQLVGCEVASTMAAPNDEYVAWRKVRTSSSVEARLKASHAYLERFPHGHWTEEVRPWFLRAEAKYYVRREESPPGLEEYLEVLPRGPHAEEARLELERHRARVAEGVRSRIEIDARYTEARLAELARQRENARESFASWVGRLLSIESWGERTTSLDHEFIYAWRIDKPRGRCVEDRCSKLVEQQFELPGGGDQVARELDFEVILLLQQGMLQQTSLQGPHMFSRLYEASASKPVLAGDAQARVQAIAFAVDVLNGAAEARLAASRCHQDAVGSVVFKRACDGWSIEAIAAEEPAVDDQVIVRGPSK